MKAATRRWVAKAEGDRVVAESLLQRRASAVNDGICFHCQQCVEKYLKAVLQELDIRFDRTHNLTALLNQIVPRVPEWELLRPDLAELNQFAVAFRYPGQDADRRLARRAFRQMMSIRDTVRARLAVGEAATTPAKKPKSPTQAPRARSPIRKKQS